jgi:hypothetical protein
MVVNVAETLLQVLFWPGNTVLTWLLTSHPDLAAWLGVSATGSNLMFSSVISVLAGWMLMSGMCHLILLVVQRWEAQGRGQK